MRDFQNAFDAALAGVDSTIVEVMGIRAQFTSGAQRGGEVQGVFDDPESLGFAGGGVRIEGSSPSLFVRTDIRITLSGICFLSATARTGAGWGCGRPRQKVL
ncbi:portal protein, partial [Escherichia coli HVH 183 (4-3205932)]